MWLPYKVARSYIVYTSVYSNHTARTHTHREKEKREREREREVLDTRVKIKFY